MESSNESDRNLHTENCKESMAYLAALNAVNLILLDTATFQRNNNIVYTAGLSLAITRLAEGDNRGVQLLDTIQKSLAENQLHLLKTSHDCAEILMKFKSI